MYKVKNVECLAKEPYTVMEGFSNGVVCIKRVNNEKNISTCNYWNLVIACDEKIFTSYTKKLQIYRFI